MATVAYVNCSKRQKKHHNRWHTLCFDVVLACCASLDFCYFGKLSQVGDMSVQVGWSLVSFQWSMLKRKNPQIEEREMQQQLEKWNILEKPLKRLS